MRHRPWRKTPTYAEEEVVLVFGCSGPLNVLRGVGRLSLARERGRVRVYAAQLEGAVPNPSPWSSPLLRGERRSANLQATNPRCARHTHLFSNGKITFQSFFMLITVQPFFFASS
jgi:hypothetical protein